MSENKCDECGKITESEELMEVTVCLCEICYIEDSNGMEEKETVWKALDGELFIHKISCTEHNQKVIEKYTYFQNIDEDDEKEWDLILNDDSKSMEFLKFFEIRNIAQYKLETE